MQILTLFTDDLRRIANWAELKIFSFPKVIDLSWLAWEVASSELPRSAQISGYAPASVALSTLSLIFGGIKLDKTLTLVSDWHGSEITEQQVLCPSNLHALFTLADSKHVDASMDVVAACAVYHSLLRKLPTGIADSWFMTINAENNINGISDRRWKGVRCDIESFCIICITHSYDVQVPNVISVVDGLELAIKQKEQAKLDAQKMRLELILPMLRSRKSELTGDIKRLEERMKGAVRRAIEKDIVL